MHGNVRQQVVQKAHASLHGVLPAAVQVDGDFNVSLIGLALHGRGTHG
jgi:hypothetical protein